MGKYNYFITVDNRVMNYEDKRFISLIHAERFDYTEWRKDNLFKDMTIEELSHAAMNYRRSKESAF